MKGRRIRFDHAMPLVILARRGEESNHPRDAIVCTDDPTPMLMMKPKGFTYQIASPPTLDVWATAVERGVPHG